MTHHSRALLRALALLLPLAANAAPVDPFPAPGLYRIDGDSTIETALGSERLIQDGATGSAELQARRAGKAAEASRALPGTAPARLCMPARAVNGGIPLRSGCRGGAGVPGPDGVTYSTSCSFADITTVVRKVDKLTWEYKITTAEHGGADMGGMPSLAMQRQMVEFSAKNGATAEEREEASATLRNWKQHEAEMRAIAAESAPRGAAGGGRAAVQRKSASVFRLTRIADACSVAAAAPLPR